MIVVLAASQACPILLGHSTNMVELKVLHLKAGRESVLNAKEVLQQQLAQAKQIEEARIRVEPEVVLCHVSERYVLQVHLEGNDREHSTAQQKVGAGMRHPNGG